MNAITQAERKAELGGAPAWMYYFTYNTPMDGGKYRAFHTAELPLVLRLVRYPNSDKVSKQLVAHGPPSPAMAIQAKAGWRGPHTP
jgi:para-nitrobenzyl esterase